MADLRNSWQWSLGLRADELRLLIHALRNSPVEGAKELADDLIEKRRQKIEEQVKVYENEFQKRDRSGEVQ